MTKTYEKVLSEMVGTMVLVLMDAVWLLASTALPIVMMLPMRLQ